MTNKVKKLEATIDDLEEIRDNLKQKLYEGSLKCKENGIQNTTGLKDKIKNSYLKLKHKKNPLIDKNTFVSIYRGNTGRVLPSGSPYYLCFDLNKCKDMECLTVKLIN